MLGKTALLFIPGLTVGLAPTSHLVSLGSSPNDLGLYSANGLPITCEQRSGPSGELAYYAAFVSSAYFP